MAFSEDFKRRTQILGHDLVTIQRDGSQTTKRSLTSIQEFQDLVVNFLGGKQAAVPAATSLYDKAFDYIHGRGELSDDELETINKEYPIELNLFSYGDIILTKEKLVGPSAAPTIDSYYSLTIKAGGYIKVETTVYIVTVDKMIVGD